jgi:hypothetical protein
MTRDGGELGRGFRRKAADLQASIDHALDRQRLANLSDPLDGMPEDVISDLRAIERSLWLLLHSHDKSK